MKKISTLFILLASLSFGAIQRMEVGVLQGDTLNQILRANHISQTEINQLNIKQFKPFNSLAPHNIISLVAESEHGTLLSCRIDQGHRSLVVNKLHDGFHLSIVKNQQDYHSHHLHTKTEYPLDSNYTRYKRLVKSVDHTFEGHADILTLHNEPIGVKTYHQDHVTLYFINHQSDQKYVSSTKDVKPQLLFSRTPAEYKRISSHFDPNRVHPVSNKVKPHNGVDLAGPINTPVWAAADGVISHISTDTSFGNFIMISHPLQATTSYAHLNKFYRHLKVGDEVKAFQTIGFIGSTGLSTGPHLHFEYRINSKAFDPLTVQPLKSSTIPSFEQNFF